MCKQIPKEIPEQKESDPSDELCAAHEAGHAYVNVALGRGMIKMSIDRDESGRRGVFNTTPAPDSFTDFDECLLLLAGPRAQYELVPNTLDSAKQEAFKERLVYEGARGSLHEHYAYTGWQDDLKPIARYLMAPSFSLAVGNGKRAPAKDVIEQADRSIRDLFRDEEVRSELCKIAAILLVRRTLEGSEARALIAALPLVESGQTKARLAWPL